MSLPVCQHYKTRQELSRPDMRHPTMEPTRPELTRRQHPLDIDLDTPARHTKVLRLIREMAVTSIKVLTDRQGGIELRHGRE